MSKYANLEEICFTLAVFVDEIKKQSASISAFENVVGTANCSNVFLSTATDAIWRELITEIAKLFDPSTYNSNENCSFIRLKEECLEEENFEVFAKGEKDDLIRKIDSVIEFYNTLSIKKARNKQLGHHDMKQIFDDKPIEVHLTDIERLISLMSDTLETIYNRISFAEVTLSNYNKIKQKCECDLKHLIG